MQEITCFAGDSGPQAAEQGGGHVLRGGGHGLHAPQHRQHGLPARPAGDLAGPQEAGGARLQRRLPVHLHAHREWHTF